MRIVISGAAAVLLVACASIARAVEQESGHASAASPYVGVVKSVDKNKGTITVELPLSKEAQITRDGAKAPLGAVQKGDDVGAEFDPKADGITRLDVESKQMMEQQMKK
jgi:hypothetical protein